MGGTRRLTTAQAVVAFLRQQHVERDGDRGRFIAGVFGIFGHGNVAGLGEALEADVAAHGADALRYHQARNEQGMVHTASAYAKQLRRLRTFACTSSIGPGATNMVTGAATATVNRLPVLLLPGDLFAHAARVPGPPAAGAAGEPGCERQRRLPAGVPLLGPDRPARAARDRAAGRVPGADVASRRRARSRCACRRTSRQRRGTSPTRCSRSAPGSSRGRDRTRRCWPGPRTPSLPPGDR